MNTKLVVVATLALWAGTVGSQQAPRERTNPVAAKLTGNWLNAQQVDVDKAVEGHVTVVHFFTFECVNCKANNPFYNRWHKEFGPEVALIGVHTPETESERDENHVRAAMKRLGISYPVLLDPEHKTWDAWNLRYWPTVFVFDKKGHLRQTWEGEFQYHGQHGFEKLTALIQKLVKE